MSRLARVNPSYCFLCGLCTHHPLPRRGDQKPVRKEQKTAKRAWSPDPPAQESYEILRQLLQLSAY